MFRPSAKLLLLIAVLALGLQALSLFFSSQPAFALRLSGQDLLLAGAPTLALLFVGRTLLSWMPAGRPGGHGLGELPRTLATSLALAFVFLAVVRGIQGPDATVSAWWLLLWAAIAGLRLATLPASLVPGHPLPHEPSPRVARWTLAAALVGLTWLTTAASIAEPVGTLFGLETNERLLVPHQLAVAVLLDHGLREARRAPLARALAVLFLALSIPYGMGASLSAALGCAFLPGWLRRADRRACLLSALGFLGVAAEGSPLVGCAGLVALVLLGRPTQARDAVRMVLLPAVLAAAALWSNGTGGAAGASEPGSWERLFLEFPFWRIPLGALVVTLGLLIGLLGRSEETSNIAEPARECLALLGLNLLGLYALWEGRPQAIPTQLTPIGARRS